MRWHPDRALLTAIAVIALDQLSKRIAFDRISTGDEINVLPGVSFNRVENTGIAFGTFAERPLLVFGLMSVALAVLIVFYLRNRTRSGLWLATGLLLGGAFGNAIDRVSLGYVRDFIAFPHFPSFNVADVAITFGVIVLVLTIERGSDEENERDVDPAT